MNEVQASIDHCRGMIAKGSKSFSLAARIFGKETRAAAFSLYGWCRYCDDAIDGSELGMRAPRLMENSDGETALNRLKEQTMSVYSGEIQNHPVFIAFQDVVKRYRIPVDYPLELLEGMAMDVRKDRYETLNGLLLYCYRVAGTVGLMMSHIMGLRFEHALKNACDMGIAMQLTNIARDVRDDAAMGRVYLPMQWLRDEGLTADDVLAGREWPRVAVVVRRLLKEAEKFYQSGDAGLFSLAFRPACAISAARHVYSEIGRCVEKKGASAWRERTVISPFRKIFVMTGGLWRVTRSIPPRLAFPWKRQEIKTIWRLS